MGTLKTLELAPGFHAALSIPALQALPPEQRGEAEGAGDPTVFPLLPLAPFLPSGCVYAVVSLPLSLVSFRCWLISQESHVPLPQPVPSSSFYLAALFSRYVRSAALDAFSKHNESGPAQPSTPRET